MKKHLSALIALSLVTQLSFAQIKETSPSLTAGSVDTARVIPIEDLLPADTLGFVVTTHLSGLVQSFKMLDAYKVALARLPREVTESGDTPVNIASRFLTMGIEDSRALDEARVGFAMIIPALEETGKPESREEDKDNPPVNQSRMPQPIIIAYVEGVQMEQARKARDQFLTYYNETFNEIGKLSEIKQADYREHKIDRLKNGEVGTWFGATYVISQQAGIDRLIDLEKDRRTPRLSDDLEFMRWRMQLMPSTGLFAYLQGAQLERLLGEMIGAGAAVLGGIGSAVKSIAQGDNSIKSVALASTFEREGVVDRLVVNFGSEKNMLAGLLTGTASDSKAMKMVPAGAEVLISLGLNWSRVYEDLVYNIFFRSMVQSRLMQKYYSEYEQKAAASKDKNQKPEEIDWSEIQKRTNSEITEDLIAKELKKYEADLNKELGFDIRAEITKDLGQEVTIAYGFPKAVLQVELDENNNPKPAASGWTVLLGIKDRAAVQQALIKVFSYMMSGMGNTMKSEDESGSKPEKTEDQLQQERLQREKNAQSAWALMPTEIYKNVEIKSVFAAYLGFAEDYMIVADSKESIKQMLDLPDGGRSIASDYNYGRAMNSSGAVGATRIFITPKYFDDLLNDMIRSWVPRPDQLEADLSARVPLNVPATVAATLQMENNSLKLEAFSPLGIPGSIALWGLGSEIQSKTERNEREARQLLQTLARAQKSYAAKNLKQFTSLETLARTKTEGLTLERLYDEQGNYKIEFKLKPGRKAYEATATPIKYGRLGRRSFFLNESGVIRSSDKQGAKATASDEEDEEDRARRANEAEAEKAQQEIPAPKPVRRRR